MTATITELFPETWDERVRRLSLKVKHLRRVMDPVLATQAQRTEWRLVNSQLAQALGEVPE